MMVSHQKWAVLRHANTLGILHDRYVSRSKVAVVRDGWLSAVAVAQVPHT
jgi:hypothetical protein